MNPDHHIATISSKKELKMQIKVEKGTGYRPVATQSKEADATIGLLKLDASFSPIITVTYSVEAARVETTGAEATELSKGLFEATLLDYALFCVYVAPCMDCTGPL